MTKRRIPSRTIGPMTEHQQPSQRSVPCKVVGMGSGRWRTSAPNLQNLKPKHTYVCYLLCGANGDPDREPWLIRAYQSRDEAHAARKLARLQLKAFHKAYHNEPRGDSVPEDRRIYRKFRRLCTVDTVAREVLTDGEVYYTLVRLDLW